MNDAVLQPFLFAESESAADLSLATLVSDQATPLLQSIIRRKLHASSARREEEQEILNAALLRVLARVRACRAAPEEHPIQDFNNCIAGIAFHVCADYWRERFPRRHALKSKLRYLLTHQAGLALWQTDELMAGYAAWQGRKSAARSEITKLKDAPYPLQNGGSTLDAVLATLNHLKAPLSLDDLTSVIAAAQGLDEMPVSLDQPEEARQLVTTSRDAESAMIQRDALARLWEEVEALPVRQKTALLLGLRDVSGSSLLALLPHTGVASLPQIARVIEITEMELAALWNDLPLDDQHIAERLQLTRQQIINLRKSARERLTRRLKNVW